LPLKRFPDDRTNGVFAPVHAKATPVILPRAQLIGGSQWWTPKDCSEHSKYGWLWDTQVVSTEAAGVQVIQ
jgi:hypothetical protein